jgi:hypothetical protein
MKNLIYLLAFVLVFVFPSLSFTTLKGRPEINHQVDKQSIVELGQFNYGAYTYTVYINDVTNAITDVIYTDGFNWYNVYSFRYGTYNPSQPNYVSNLKIWTTSTSTPFSYTGAVLPM